MKSLTIYLTPNDVAVRLTTLGIPCIFSREDLTTLSTTPVVERSERIFVFPTPTRNEFLNLNFIRSCVGVDPSKPPSFFDHPWYRDEPFMQQNCSPGWHVLMMDVLEDSILQPANYLDSAKHANLSLPSATEVVLMLFLHYMVTGEQLLLKKHTWCSDSASLGRQVTVGAFGRNGLFVSGHPPHFASRGLGICAKVATEI